MSSARVPDRGGQPAQPQAGTGRATEAGFDVIEARTGEEGVARARRRKPDVILMDLQLPGINGTQALRLIRTTRAEPTSRSSP